jgi:putative hydrolase of HD superfamily
MRDEMKPEKVIEFLKITEKLKCNTRHSWTSTGRRESVAEHSFQLMVLAWSVKDEFPDIDMEKVMKMCLFHDFGEAITGDIPSFEKTTKDEKIEEEAVFKALEILPEEQRKELVTLFEEMNDLNTKEAKLYKALDKMEAVIQHNEASLETWLPLEYELQFTYGEKETQEFSYTRELKAYVNKMTEKKIKGSE